MSRDEQYNIMMKFFKDCVRFWEHELKTDSDLDRRPYENALMEIPTVDPFKPHGEPIDSDVREEFIKSRFMDTYGKDWERYYNEKRRFIR